MIAFESVSVAFGGAPVLHDVSLEVDAGALCVLVGPSGSGKSTLMRLVNRLVAPTAGTVRVRGEDVARLDPARLRRSIGYAIQSVGLFPHRTVAQNIGTVPRLLGWEPGAHRTARGGAARPGAPRSRLGDALPGGAVRRAGAARRPRPRARRGSRHPADGRALRRRGPHRAAGVAGRAAPHPRRDGQDGAARHPRPGRGAGAGDASRRAARRTRGRLRLGAGSAGRARGRLRARADRRRRSRAAAPRPLARARGHRAGTAAARRADHRRGGDPPRSALPHGGGAERRARRPLRRRTAKPRSARCRCARWWSDTRDPASRAAAGSPRPRRSPLSPRRRSPPPLGPRSAARAGPIPPNACSASPRRTPRSRCRVRRSARWPASASASR